MRLVPMMYSSAALSANPSTATPPINGGTHEYSNEEAESPSSSNTRPLEFTAVLLKGPISADRPASRWLL